MSKVHHLFVVSRSSHLYLDIDKWHIENKQTSRLTAPPATSFRLLEVITATGRGLHWPLALLSLEQVHSYPWFHGTVHGGVFPVCSHGRS